MAASRFHEVRDAVVERVGAGASLPDAARGVGVHPSTVKGWITRGRREGSGPFAEFEREVAEARVRARGRPGALSEEEFRRRLEESVRAGSVQAMALWARLYHRDGDAEAGEPRTMVDQLAERRRKARRAS